MTGPSAIGRSRAGRRRSPSGAFLLCALLAAALLAAALSVASPPQALGQTAGQDAAEGTPPPLAALRAELIASAQRIMLLHHELIALDRELAGLAAEEAEQAEDLARQRQRAAAAAGALYRLARLPPALVLAGPGEPDQRVRSAMVLGDLVPRLAERARAHRQALADLAGLRRELEARRAERDGLRQALGERLADLRGRIDRRQALRESAPGQDGADRDAAALSAEARGLQALLQDLAEGRTGAAGAGDPDGGSRPTRPMLPLATQDGIILPSSGLIVGPYGEPGRFGDPRQGLRLSVYPGAPVVAPIDGTVRYAGPFEPYGQILILEHAGGYHSLIAGLGRIDVAEGQGVLAGEPVALTSSPEGRQIGAPTLYYELRLRGRPIDPIQGLLRAQERGQG